MNLKYLELLNECLSYYMSLYLKKKISKFYLSAMLPYISWILYCVVESIAIISKKKTKYWSRYS